MLTKWLVWLILLTPTAPEESSKAVADLLARVAANNRPRVAWDRVVAHGPQSLLPLLRAMPRENLQQTNWLATAFDRIVEQNDQLPVEALLDFAKDTKHLGQARRLALEAVEKRRPGTRERLLAGWLTDPEFREDAVSHLVNLAETALAAKEKTKALTRFRQAFETTQQIDRIQELAERLRELGENPNLYSRLGVVTDWHVIGAFRAPPDKAFALKFPPESSLDLDAVYTDAGRSLRWKRIIADSSDGRIDLIPHVQGEGVAYLSTRLNSKSGQSVELRASAVDNLTVWLNGERVIHHGIAYRSHFRLDWHTAQVCLKPGENTLLVKASRAPAGEERGGRKAKWEVLLRLVDRQGKGLVFSASK